ncbi:MAG: hypothetical protein ACT4PU_13550 [Planctomycetota bacterium]
MDRDLRRLLLFVAGGAVLLFTGRALIGALYDADDAIRQAAAMRGKLRSGGEAGSRPSREALQAASALRDELLAELERLAPAVQYEQPPEFSVPAGQSPDLAYLEIVRREQQALVRRAAFEGRSVPANLGLPDLNPTGLEDVLRTLRSLHIVHRVVDAALQSGIDAVDSIRPPTAARRTRVESGFLRTHRVEFELRGTPRAVRDTLAAIAGGQPYLALDEVRLEALDDEGARVKCRFSAGTVQLDLEQALLSAGEG